MKISTKKTEVQYSVILLQKPKLVHAASERQDTAAGEVQINNFVTD